MYLNNVILTGFLGSDAKVRTTQNNANFTILSLATKSSWKGRENDEWLSRTDWHRAVVFGRLSEFAATLKKGNHVQIQGHLRTREYQKPADNQNQSTILQRVTEIRVTSILKLDRNTQPQSSRQKGAAA